MIQLTNIFKTYTLRRGRHTVLDRISLTVQRGEKIGILGRNGAGKSTLIRILSGAEQPDGGVIHRSMSISWPLAFGGAFQGGLTGMDNLRFVCRIYGADITKAAAFTEAFSDLGNYLHEPVKTYSSGMRARLAFALSMAVDFDCFLIDEIVAVGDQRFHDKCHAELFERRKDKAMVIVSHDAHYIRAHCQRACVLDAGKLHTFGEVDEAFEFYGAAS